MSSFYLQSLILYGLYPYVVDQLSDLVTLGAYVGVRLTSTGSMWRVDCNLIEGTEVTTVLLGVIRSGEKWQSNLTRLVATTLSCVNSISQLRVICVDEHINVGRAIGSGAVPTVPVVMRVFDVQWVQRVIRSRFTSQFSGLDPYSVLDFLKYRLAGVINDSYFDKLPELRSVSCKKNFRRKRKEKKRKKSVCVSLFFLRVCLLLYMRVVVCLRVILPVLRRVLRFGSVVLVCPGAGSQCYCSCSSLCGTCGTMG